MRGIHSVVAVLAIQGRVGDVAWTETTDLGVVPWVVCTVINIALGSAIRDGIAIISATVSRKTLLGICVIVS